MDPLESSVGSYVGAVQYGGRYSEGQFCWICRERFNGTLGRAGCDVWMFDGFQDHEAMATVQFDKRISKLTVDHGREYCSKEQGAYYS